jgi:phytoene dehydrogenase-like protein
LGIGSPFLGSLPLLEHGLDWAEPPVPFAHAMDGGDSVLLHRSMDDTEDELGSDGPRWRSVFGPFVKHWDRTVGLATAPPLRAIRAPLTGLRLARYGLRSGHHLAHRFDTARGRAVIAGLAAHSIAPLTTAASGGVALLLGAATHTVGWPFARGGSAAIAAAMASYLESLGGEIRTGTWVRRMSDIPSARVVLFDTSAQSVASIAGERMSARRRRAYRTRPVGAGSFKLDVVTDGPVPWSDQRLA